MADNIEDTGSFSVFPFDFNWQSNPSTYDIARRLFVHPGTSHYLETFIDLVPIKFKGKILLDGEEEIYDWFDWWNTYKGRVKKFFVKFYRNSFTLIEDAGLYATHLRCSYNDFHLNYQGHERIFLELESGDLITRQITSISENESSGYIDLNISATDRIIETGDVFRFGRLLLCRFDSDAVSIDFKSLQVAELTTSFYETITEYSEIT